MKNTLQLILVTVASLFFSFTVNAQTNTTGYYPMKIKNRAGGSSNVSAVYFIMTGQMWDANATNAVLRFTWSADSSGYFGHLDKVTATTNSSAYSYRIDTLPGYNTADSTLLLYIPHLQSGRCMVSLNYMMQFPPVAGSNGVFSLQEPNINNPGDANSGILFDKFEFSYDTTGTSGTLYIDPTAVDFFAIPISISIAGNTSGAAPDAKRDKLMSTMRATITKYDKTPNKIWSSLAMYDATNTTVLRLAAPYLAPNFDLSYLSNANQYGINYIDSLCSHYINTNDTIIINCSELNQTGFEVFDIYNQTPTQNPGAYIFYGTMINTGDSTIWSFTNNPSTGASVTRTVNMSLANSFDFFAPGVAPFDTPNKTIKSIIVRQISSAFTVGLLPAPDAIMLNSNYLNAPKNYPYYTLNNLINGATATNGPWYNLYTRAIHSAIPQLYAFAFDDELGQSGTLTSASPSDTVQLTIGNMGSTVIPQYTYYPPLQALSITNSPTFTVDTASKSSSAIINYTVPQNQPENAQYFFIPYGGSGYVVSVDTLISWQMANPASTASGSYTLTLPDSIFGNGNPSGAGIQVLTCGGIYACPTKTDIIIPGGPASISGMQPLPASNVSWTAPAAVVSNGDTTAWTTTISWSSPANQLASTNYYWLLNSAGIMNSDSLIWMQLPGYSVANDTSVTVSIPAGWFVGGLPASGAMLQILTCGGIISCPSAANLFIPGGSGTAPVLPSGSANATKAIKAKTISGKGKK